MTLHPDEVAIDTAGVARLLRRQAPQWARLALTPAGAGTDNLMFRLGAELVVRLPRHPGTAGDVDKEQTWLPRLAPQLPLEVPTPVLHGRPDEDYPHPWSVYRWIPGDQPGPGTVTDWTDFGTRLAGFVDRLHTLETTGATRSGSLDWYRGRRLHDLADTGFRAIEEVRALPEVTDPGGGALDLAAVEQLWRTALAVDDPVLPHGWLHGDLRAANLLARGGRLVAVLDFGVLSLGNPTAEHAAIWEYPAPARAAYRDRLGLDEATWQRARGWKLLVCLQAISHYWRRWPDLALSSLDRVRVLLDATH